MKMNKLFLVLSFTLLFVSKIFGQAQVDIPLIVTDGIITFQMSVGLDLTATNGIDPQLGESDLPPIPPTGIIEIRFDLAPYTGQPLSSYKDYRAPGNPPVFPYTGTIEHTLFWFNGPPAPTLDITYNIPNGAFITITDLLGGVILNLGPFTGQGVATIPSSYTNIFSSVLLIMDYDNIVPVEFISFTASVLQNKKTVQLNWTTASETNNSGFEIQRTSPLPSPYKERVAKPGEVGKQLVLFRDLELQQNQSLILLLMRMSRQVFTNTDLKQIDFDGTFEYSNEIEVEVDFTPKDFVLYQNYPNPFNPNTIISFEIPGQARNDNVLVTLKVYDVLGNEVATFVNEEKQPGVYDVEFYSSSGLSPDKASGIYFYQLKAGSFTETKKMILLR